VVFDFKCNYVTIDNIDTNAAISRVEKILDEEKGISPNLRSTLELLLVIITLLVNRLNLNSHNSSKPPSTDSIRKREKKAKRNRKPGGQPGHDGTTLKKVDIPDDIEELEVDRRTIPPGRYTEVGYESRQVIDIDISRFVKEYRTQVLKDQHGNLFVAEFPEHLNRPVQYGAGLKANSVYLFQFQLIPYNRIHDYFLEHVHIPISEGSIYNFNREAFQLLETFDEFVKNKLVDCGCLHADETSINISGKRHWIHCASNVLWTHYYPHRKRG